MSLRRIRLRTLGAEATAAARQSAGVRPRRFHDFIRGPTTGGTYKVPLKGPKVVGEYSSRGYREYQEDATSVHALQIDSSELQATLKKQKKPYEWEPSSAGSDFLAGQVAYFGIFDGHGGKEVSKYLSGKLHSLIESVSPAEIQETVEWTKEHHGGYYKRWRGGALQSRTTWGDEKPDDGQPMTLEERLTLTFLEADKKVHTTIENAERCGSTASVVLLHSLDEPAQPYWAAKKLALTIAHCGDTRVLLCQRETGQSIALTEKHHAEARIEASRLRRMGAGLLVSDSYGDSRWMGAVENTRGFGDGQWKPSGVTVEPEVSTRIIDGDAHSYIILVTDGITSLISDQEIIDLARRSIDPLRAAKTVVHFAEDLGAQDNCTCIVVPLAGWGNVGGEDRTAERREYRRKNAEGMNTRMQRM
ncbi:hypothetical protein IAT38_007203 [Cryptococcus sp. DSM 104549]